LNCQYDFVPTNNNFLVASRLNFALKKNKIQNVILKRKREQKLREKTMKKQ
jgi:hypothetical protein